MGDLNAKVGADNTGCERIMGKHGPGTVMKMEIDSSNSAP